MFLLPYGHIQIKIELSREAVEQRLSEHLEPRRFLYGMFRGEHKFFEGSISNGHFDINRVVNYKNSFNPVLTGELQSNSGHTIININVRFDFVYLAMLSIVFLVILFIYLCLPLQFVRISDISISSLPRFLANSLKVPAIVYLIVIALFNLEVSKALDYLENLFASK